jgi:hypothetical protein
MKRNDFANLLRLSRLAAIMLVVIVAVSSVGCKDKKKTTPVVNEQAIIQEKIKNAKAQLEALLNDNTLSPEEKERKLNEIRGLNLNNEELNSLASKVDEKIKLQREEIKKIEEEKKRIEEEKKAKLENVDIKTKLNRAFDEIATLGQAGANDKANAKINETMQLFTSEAADVLIIIAKQGTEVDYDEPTTIKKFLSYLKDRKESKNVVDKLELDANGKIKLMEMVKK